jgi:hypothetical protein
MLTVVSQCPLVYCNAITVGMSSAGAIAAGTGRRGFMGRPFGRRAATAAFVAIQPAVHALDAAAGAGDDHSCENGSEARCYQGATGARLCNWPGHS